MHLPTRKIKMFTINNIQIECTAQVLVYDGELFEIITWMPSPIKIYTYYTNKSTLGC